MGSLVKQLLQLLFKGQYMAVTVAKHNVSPEIAQQLQTDISVKQEAIKDRSASLNRISSYSLYICLLLRSEAQLR